MFSSQRLCDLDETCDPLIDVVTSVEKALQDNPPIQITEGGLIRDGYHPELDELRAISPRENNSSLNWKLKSRTGINSLKVKFNIFGCGVSKSEPQLGSCGL